jgi:hypothetical protein
MTNQEGTLRISPKTSKLFLPLRNLVFGPQNERLEYLMDSFLKFSPEQRAAAVVGGILGFLLLLVGLISLYLGASSALQNDLDFAFSSTNRLKEVQVGHLVAKRRFAELESALQINQSLSLITLVEAKAKEMGILVGDFPSQQEISTPAAPLNASALKNHRIAKIRFSVNKSGLKKVVEFLVALESLPNRLRVSSLSIKRSFSDKLYLDASVEIEAVLPPEA